MAHAHKALLCMIVHYQKLKHAIRPDASSRFSRRTFPQCNLDDQSVLISRSSRALTILSVPPILLLNITRSFLAQLVNENTVL